MTTEETHDRLLEGLKIIDAGQVLGGPFVGSLVGDFGADVIKIELPLPAQDSCQAEPLRR